MPRGLTDAIIASSINYACPKWRRYRKRELRWRTIESAVSNAIKSGACANTLFVFAAGNGDDNGDADLEPNDNAHNMFPCEYHRSAAAGGADATNVLCVAATQEIGTLSSFSNYGDTAVHLGAPGVDIWSALPTYSILPGWPDGFEGTTAAFNSRWNGRLITIGDKIWNRKTGVRSRAPSASPTRRPGTTTTRRPPSAAWRSSARWDGAAAASGTTCGWPPSLTGTSS